MKKLLLGILFIPFCATAMEQDASTISTLLAKLIALQSSIVNPGEFTTQSKIYDKLSDKNLWIKLKSRSTISIEFWASEKNTPELTTKVSNCTVSLQRKEVTQENLEKIITQQTKSAIESIIVKK